MQHPGSWFFRLRCANCDHEKLVALSWKRCGFYDFCGARRMVKMATHLVDHPIAWMPVVVHIRLDFSIAQDL